MFSLFVTARLCLFLYFLDTAFNGLQIFQLEFGVNDFFVTDRIYTTVYMSYIFIVKTTEYVQDSICFTDICQKLVSQPFTFASPFYKSCNVNNFYSSGNDTSRMNQFGKFGQAFIRNGDDTYIRFDGTEREVGCLSLCIR